VGCRPDSLSVNLLCSDSRSQISCGLRPAQAQGRRVRSDQSPETGGNGGVEREFDLANIDGSAGVRNSRENMEVEGGRLSGGGKTRGVMMNKEIKLSSMVRGGSGVK
jgi:hypothetical protein